MQRCKVFGDKWIPIIWLDCETVHFKGAVRQASRDIMKLSSGITALMNTSKEGKFGKAIF